HIIQTTTITLDLFNWVGGGCYGSIDWVVTVEEGYGVKEFDSSQGSGCGEGEPWSWSGSSPEKARSYGGWQMSYGSSPEKARKLALVENKRKRKGDAEGNERERGLRTHLFYIEWVLFCESIFSLPILE
ncbi:unnamed protein product, partial [Prunus brigantina]